MAGIVNCLRRFLVAAPSLDRKFLPALARASSSQPSTSEYAPVPQVDYEPDKLYRLLDVELRGNDPAVLRSYSWFATTAAKELGIRIGECWTPRKAHHQRWTLLKSVHIYKKHRVQYEVRTYYRYMQFLQLTGSTADTFLEYIQRNLPEGVAMKVTRHELQHLPEHLVPSEEENSEDSLRLHSS